MNWHPMPIVLRAVPIRTVGMYVLDETGRQWGSLSIFGGSCRCQWCHAEFTIGWTSFRGSVDVCKMHIVVDWSGPWAELDYPSYRGVGDPIHQKPRRRRKAG